MVIQCDQCGKEIRRSPARIRDGDIEYTFLRCEECGAVYPMSVTDSALRNEIDAYVRMREHIAGNKIPEGYIRQAEERKQRNIKRARELMEQYPLAPFFSEHQG